MFIRRVFIRECRRGITRALSGNNRRVKKYAVIVFVFLLLAAATTLVACDFLSDGIVPRSDISDEVLRIHIRANSNDDNDQTVKLAVRDALTDYLSNLLSSCRDKSEAQSVLQASRDEIDGIAEAVLAENGFAYGARVVFSHEHFPKKTYGEYTFPEGDYDAMLVLLGEGTGDNWWCVAFPPLCFVPGDGENVVYKSWVKEKLEEIFG